MMNPRRLSGFRRPSFKDRDESLPTPTATPSGLPTPVEGVEMATPPMSRSSSAASLPSYFSPFKPLTPKQTSNSSTDGHQLERTVSRAESTATNSGNNNNNNNNNNRSTTDLKSPSSGGAFSRMTSMMSSLVLSRDSTDDKERGRSASSAHFERTKRSSSTATDRARSRGRSEGDAQDMRSRSQSPFRLRRFRTRDRSPSVGALAQSDYAESDTDSIRPRGSAYFSDDEDGDYSGDEDEDAEEDTDTFDSDTERNTESNALAVPEELHDVDIEQYADPLGEGQNVVVPPEPYFPTTLNHSNARNPRRRKSTRHAADPLPFHTGRPVFQRDRCTITIKQGDPDAALVTRNRKRRRYIVASDISDESRYAVEWAVGTVLRDGDELLIVTVIESDSKTDPAQPGTGDRAAKLRSQQERQGMSYILCRQATSLLQRTRLNVTISCEAWHAKHARHMLLDIVDHIDPVMLIVGSRGLGHIKGILLGSTSHYLIQKASVPVMVARRRLKRPPRKNAHLAKHRARVSLAEAAGVERVTQRVDEEVAHMRDEIQAEEDRETARMKDQERLREGAEEDEEEADEGEAAAASSIAAKAKASALNPYEAPQA